tara:strand:- start:210 stop:338 length:129 start_codon:yes stop_codon:yes gene_type:complete
MRWIGISVVYGGLSGSVEDQLGFKDLRRDMEVGCGSSFFYKQ